MKKFYLAITAMIIAFAGNAQLFNQNFQSSTALGSYASVTPTNAQFNEIYDGDAGSGMVISINSVTGANTLRYVRSGNATGGYTRSTNFTTSPSVMKFTFDISVSGNIGTDVNSAASWYFGNGYTNGGTAPGNTLNYSYFFLDLDENGATDRARFRSPGNALSAYFPVSQSQNITYIINNSGSTITYNAPNGSIKNLADDEWDLWIGSTLGLSDLQVMGPDEVISDMKFLFTGGNGTIDLDNLVAEELTDYPVTFYQDFSSSSNYTNYAAASPNSGQFNNIYDGATGGGNAGQMVISISNAGGGNALRFAKNTDGTGTGGAAVGSFTRTTNFSNNPTSMMMEFDMAISGSLNDNTSAIGFYVGEDFSTGSSTPSGFDTHSYFQIDFDDNGTTDRFRLRKGGVAGTTEGTNVSAWFNVSATPYRILFVTNNSGSAKSYYTPAGTIESLPNDQYVLWVGTTKAFYNSNGSATATGADLDNVKFLFADGVGTVDLDNILINPIPVVNATSTPEIVSNTFNPRFIAKWTMSAPVSSITGYRLDVATDLGFTTYVPGFQNLYVDGPVTLSQLVQGVSTLNSHHIRVRPVYKIGINEVSGAYSNISTLSSAIFLPVTLTSFTGSVVNKAGELKWVSESEVNNSHYEVERGSDGSNFVSVGSVNSKNSATGATYAFKDGSIAEGKNYYRLKMIDLDGKFEYSHVIMLNYAGGMRTMSAYPNPTVGNVTVQFSKAGNGASMKVISLEGRVMQQMSVPANATQLRLNMANFVPGIYTIVYNNNGEQFVQRIQKH